MLLLARDLLHEFSVPVWRQDDDQESHLNPGSPNTCEVVSSQLPCNSGNWQGPHFQQGKTSTEGKMLLQITKQRSEDLIADQSVMVCFDIEACWCKNWRTEQGVHSRTSASPSTKLAFHRTQQPWQTELLDPSSNLESEVT